MQRRSVRIVVGTQLRSSVDFWTAGSSTFVPGIDAIMISFAEIMSRGLTSRAAAARGLRQYLGFRGEVFLDNGSFTLLRNGGKPNVAEYVRFVESAKPDWFPIPVDYLPAPSSSRRVAKLLAEKTASMNQEFGGSGYVPVVHMGPHFLEYFAEVLKLLRPDRLAVGGMVPYLRFGRGANPRVAIEMLARARSLFDGSLHVFGFGGGVTSLHLAAALGLDSVDSSGWRVRAAKGLILMPGRGERMITGFGQQKGAPLSSEDQLALKRCGCAICSVSSNQLSKPGRLGFQGRALHNLWVLSNEAALLNRCSSKVLRTWSLKRLRTNRMRYLVEHAFMLTCV